MSRYAWRRSVVALVGLGLGLCCRVAHGHHSLEGTYFMDRQVAIEGTLVEISVRNPHSFVTVNVTNLDGSVSRWGAEWGSATDLNQAGVDMKVLKAGDVVRIVGAPGRADADHRLLIQTIARPSDGWTSAGHIRENWWDLERPPIDPRLPQ